MSTLTGVIKAATNIGTAGIPASSDLYATSNFLEFSTTPYPVGGTEIVKAIGMQAEFVVIAQSVSAATMMFTIQGNLKDTVKYGKFDIAKDAASMNFTITGSLLNTISYGKYVVLNPSAAALNFTITGSLKNVAIDIYTSPEIAMGSFEVAFE